MLDIITFSRATFFGDKIVGRELKHSEFIQAEGKKDFKPSDVELCDFNHDKVCYEIICERGKYVHCYRKCLETTERSEKVTILCELVGNCACLSLSCATYLILNGDQINLFTVVQTILQTIASEVSETLHVDTAMDEEMTDNDGHCDMVVDDDTQYIATKIDQLPYLSTSTPLTEGNLTLVIEPLSHQVICDTNNKNEGTEKRENQKVESYFQNYKMPRTQAQKKLYAIPYHSLGENKSFEEVHSNGNYNHDIEKFSTAPGQKIGVFMEHGLHAGMTEEKGTESVEKLNKVHKQEQYPEKNLYETGDSSNFEIECSQTTDKSESLVKRLGHKKQLNDHDVTNLADTTNTDSVDISECAQALCEMSQQTMNDSNMIGAKNDTSSTENNGGNMDNNLHSPSEKGNCEKLEDKGKEITSKKKYRVLSTKPKRHQKDAEVCFAQVGASAKIWTLKHPLINGIYLNKGKREIKKNLVKLKRQPSAVDKTSYLRNGKVNDRNRIDDYFEFTEEGKKKRERFEEGLVRDEYVVNWYMWCPGHGNCLRQCGGYGKCIEGMMMIYLLKWCLTLSR